jgi:hypothetical protein
MNASTTLRNEPAPEILSAVRRWLEPVRAALEGDFIAAYLTGSVLTQGFDPRRSGVNVLIVARGLDLDRLDAVARALPESKQPHIEPLLLTQRQIEHSLDVFPIEWLDIQERHQLLEGHDVWDTIEVPRTYLRLQLEHELRGKLIQLRQAYLLHAGKPERLEPILHASASSFATLFRTLLRLRGESPPGETSRAIERVADLFKLDAQGLLAAHMIRHGGAKPKGPELRAHYRKFLVEVERLVNAIDELRVP